ncbi:D-alanyl-D-alanine carboxypeptidase family protein, partial [Streptococcus pneumoniae]
ILANKRYPLSKDYNPGENPTAKAELLKLIAAMQAEGYPISDQYSGFRSYETQAKLYQDYVNQDGKEAADRYSARPGYSEHQTGLAFDLIG